MWSLLAHGRIASTRAVHRALRAPATAAGQPRRILALALGWLVLAGGSAVGTIALTTGPSGPERGFAGLSDVRMVRDLQLPTL